ncbi:hypothetical protein X777_03564 [Ooceraea biroi]|uniref:Uncharacterized protein n=1 Tax=Ooceraea biroi TaxID=2015173 RepID=A0A026VSJ2_OOCBI|nr:hypothetical protein X777_03564 [Ooceraea biroi]
MCDLSDPISEAKQNVFIENVKRYNVMVDDLTKCLLKQTDLFTSIQHEFKHIKDSLTTRDTAHNSYVRLKKSIKLLRNYCEQFSNEQMNIITDIADRQTLITWQNRLHNNITHEKSQILGKLEHIKQEEQKLKEQEELLHQRMEELEKEIALLKEREKNLDMQSNQFLKEKKLLEEDKISIKQEREMFVKQRAELCYTQECWNDELIKYLVDSNYFFWNLIEQMPKIVYMKCENSVDQNLLDRQQAES